MKTGLVLFLYFFLVLQVPAVTMPSFGFLLKDGKTFTRENIPKDRSSFFMFVDPTCDHCQHAIHQLNTQYQLFSKVNILIISLADHRTLQQFLDKYAIGLLQRKNVVILQDKQNTFISTFGPAKYPAMFLYDKRNRLIRYEDDPNNMSRFVNAIKK